MFRDIFKSLLYLSSFIPLYILLIVQNLKLRNTDGKIYSTSEFFKQFIDNEKTTPNIFWIGIFSLLLISTITIFIFIKFFLQAEGSQGKIIGVSFSREDTLGYIVTYIIPLISIDIKSPRSLIINVILFITIGVFYVKNNQLFMNPILNIMNYNILSSDGYIYITKLTPRKMKELSREGIPVSLKNVAEDIYIVKELQK
jgi:hypothetical protein